MPVNFHLGHLGTESVFMGTEFDRILRFSLEDSLKIRN